MVKKFTEELRKEGLIQEEKLLQKAQELTLLRKRDFIRDRKRAALKQNKPYAKSAITIDHYLYHTAQI